MPYISIVDPLTGSLRTLLVEVILMMFDGLEPVDSLCTVTGSEQEPIFHAMTPAQKFVAVADVADLLTDPDNWGQLTAWREATFASILLEMDLYVRCSLDNILDPYRGDTEGRHQTVHSMFQDALLQVYEDAEIEVPSTSDSEDKWHEAAMGLIQYLCDDFDWHSMGLGDLTDEDPESYTSTPPEGTPAEVEKAREIRQRLKATASC